MCKAFSCIINKNKRVVWKLNKQNHHELVEMAKWKDNTDDPSRMNFARVEITPKNKDYLNPDKWIFKIDERIVPEWFSPAHKDACWSAFKLYEKQFYKVVQKGKVIVHPFKDIKIVRKVTIKQKLTLKRWDSVRDSVRYSVKDSVGDSVGDSVKDSVWDSVKDSVWDSVKDSVWDSVWDSVKDSVWDSVKDSVWDSVKDSVWDSVKGYIGSFFKLEKWQHLKHKKGEYPFQSVVDLWNQGLVPSFDGENWRLHSGKKAKVVFKISQKELRKYKGD